jgi:hypothetical protein
VSTDEKLGVEELELLPDKPPVELEVELPPDAALPPEEDAPEEDGVVEVEPLEPEAAGEDDEDDVSAPLVLDEELCASVTLDSANNAAAVAALRTFSFNIGDTSLQGK